jgi:16S rRNA (guanine527-N7)-methyltransferase
MELITTYFDDFTPAQLLQLGQLQALYAEWNEKINVISRKDMDNFYEHHVLHSLAIATVFTFTSGMEVLDLGCGGGFPGIPLAILFPETQFLQVDSIAKKLKVVEAVAAAIGLTNIATRHTRAEAIKDKKFDVVISRAVAPLSELVYWAKPLLKKQPNIPGRAQGLICLKGGDLAEEISASGVRPRVWPISQAFPRPYFDEKYLLQVVSP